MFQKHNIRPEEFYELPEELRLFYIASELVEAEHPCRRDTIPIKR